MGVFSGPNLKMENTVNISNIVTDQLQLYYDSARSFSYSGAGAIWKDLSGNARNLTLYNAGGTTYSTQPAGPPVYDSVSSKGIFTFDGTNDWGKFSNYTFPANVTVSIWARTSDSSGNRKGLISNCSGGPVGLSYEMNSSKMHYYYYTTSWQSAYGVATINNGAWKNLVWAKSGTNMRMYINGTLDSNTTLVGSVTAVMNCIGTSWGPCNSDSYGPGQDGYSTVWPGSIAIVMVHSKQLSDAEVLQNYDNTKRRFGL
jgi:hypothetical protein